MKQLTIKGVSLYEDGEGNRWLKFESGGRSALIRVAEHFDRATIVDSTVRNWANEQTVLDPQGPYLYGPDNGEPKV